MRDVRVHLTDGEIDLLIEALDSHEYWQLSESNERNDGYSTIEDSTNEEVDAVRALVAKLERFRRSSITSKRGGWTLRKCHNRACANPRQIRSGGRRGDPRWRLQRR